MSNGVRMQVANRVSVYFFSLRATIFVLFAYLVPAEEFVVCFNSDSEVVAAVCRKTHRSSHSSAAAS